MRVCFTKEDLAYRSKEDLEKTVNKMAEAGLISPNTKVDYDKPFDVNRYNELTKLDHTIYMNSKVWEALYESFKDVIEDDNISREDFINLVISLKAMVHPIDNKTMEQIRQLVENKENN